MFGHSHSHGYRQPPGHSHIQEHQETQEEIPCRLKALFELHSIISGNFFFDIIKYIPGIQIILKCYYNTIKNAWSSLSEMYLMLNYRITTKIFGTGKFSRLIIGYSLPTFISLAIIITHLLLNIIPNLKFSFIFLIIFIIASLVTIVTYIICFFSNPGFINANEEKTSFEVLMQARPELNSPHMICPICQIPKVCRSIHCPICNQLNKQCCTRQIKHSLLFNICIGSQNVVYWLVFMFHMSLTLIYYGILFVLPKTEEYEESFLSFQNISIFLLLLFLIYVFVQEAAIEGLFACYNITSKEFLYWRKMPYMWRNQEGEFYNPFDQKKGCKLNLYELTVPKQTNQPAFALGNYELINWYKAKIFTVMDIKTSPFRKFIINQMNQQKSELPPGMVWDPQTQTIKMDPNMMQRMQSMQQQMMQMMRNPQQQQMMMQQMQQMHHMHQQMRDQSQNQQFDQSEESSLMANQMQSDESTDLSMQQSMQQQMMQMMQNPQQQQMMMQQMQQMHHLHQQRNQEQNQQSEQFKEASLIDNQIQQNIDLQVQKNEEEVQALEINYEDQQKTESNEGKQDISIEIKEEKHQEQ